MNRTAEAYDLLARRVSHCWRPAISGDVLDCARNAVTPLALDACCSERDAFQAFAFALVHRRDLGEKGFTHLLDSQIEFLANVALQLWLVHRAEIGNQPTIPAPPLVHDYSCGCDDCDDGAPSAAELRYQDEREYALMVRRGEW